MRPEFAAHLAALEGPDIVHEEDDLDISSDIDEQPLLFTSITSHVVGWEKGVSK